MTINRARSLLVLAVLVAVASAIAIAGAFRAPVAAAQSDSRPNVILILVDNMGWSDIGSYGGETRHGKPTSPSSSTSHTTHRIFR
jgi:hypothetical protein